MKTNLYNRLSLKAALLSLFFFVAGTGVNAQVYFLNETFNSFPNGATALPYNSWTNNIIAGGSFDVWRFDNGAGRTIASPLSGKAAAFDSDWYSNGGGAENVAMESPAFNTTAFNTIVLKFAHYFDAQWGGSGYVEVFNGTTWVQVLFVNTTKTVTETVDISTHASNRTGVKVRFRYVGNWSTWWLVDNVQVYSFVDNDASVTAAATTAGMCGSANDDIAVTVKNTGTLPLSNIPVTVNVTGTVNGSAVNTNYNGNITGPLGAGASTTINLGSLNTINGSNFNITATVSHGSDQDAANNTLITNSTSIGTPAAPTAGPQSRCGVGTVNLTSTTSNSADSVLWFDQASGGNIIGMGQNVTSPFYFAGTTVYSEAHRVTPTASYFNHTTGNVVMSYSTTDDNGWMVNVTPTSTIKLSDLAVRPYYTGNATFKVYYRVGGYAGYTTNSSAWTLLGSKTVNTPASQVMTNLGIGANTILQAGVTYGFYVVATGNDIYATSGNTSNSNSDMNISGGIGIYGTWGNLGTYGGYSLDLTLLYSKMCTGPRTAVAVNINPKPNGTTVIEGSPFVGTFNSGTMGNPDIVAAGDAITYEIQPPTGFNNSGFGTTWVITSLTLQTPNGTDLPMSNYTIINPGSANGELEIIPPANFTDSTLVGTVTVVRSDNGCDTTFKRWIFVAPRPVAGYSFSHACDGDQMVFTNSSTISTGSNTYFWDFGDGNTSTLAAPSHTYSTFGNYTVKLFATSDLGYVDSSIQMVTVYQLPGTDFQVKNACAGEALVFTDMSFLPSGTPTYTWDFGDGSGTSMNANPTYTYANTGLYKVTLLVEVNGCVASKIRYATQAPRAQSVGFTATTDCNNKEAIFTNNTVYNGASIGYEWNFGDGTISNEKNPKHIFTSFGPKSVVLTANTEYGCADSFTMVVNLNESPNVSFTTNNPCLGEDVSFTNTSTEPVNSTNAYVWHFGDGNTSNSTDPTHQYPSAGTYKVMLEATSTNGCSGSTEVDVKVTPNPVAGFSAEDVCEGKKTVFMNSSTAGSETMTYNWDFGNTVTSSVKDTSFAYASAGTYQVGLTVTTSNGCTDQITHAVKVSSLPDATFISGSGEKGDGTMVFTANATGQSYQWLFGDGGRSTDPNPVYTYMVNGNFEVTLYVTNADGCMSSSTSTVKVYALAINNTNGITGQISLYPNPNAGVFNILFTDVVTEGAQATISNGIGQTVYQVNLKNMAGNQVAVDMSNMSAGVYFLEFINAEGASHSMKFVIQ